MTNALVIAGGGPVGMCLALRLALAGVSVIVLEAKPQGAYYQDDRALALSQASKLMLEALNVWPHVAAITPITSIHVSQKGSLGRSLLRAADHEMEALGYILSYGSLMQAIDQVIEAHRQHSASAFDLQIHYAAQVTNIQPDNPAAHIQYQQENQSHQLSTPLAVIADGGRSLAEIPGIQRISKEYGHHALVTKVQAELAHQGVAYERFTREGPVALLPNGEHDFSLVWTGQSDYVQQLMTLSDHDFLSQLHTHFGDRVGQFLQVQKRICFPLKLSYLDQVTAAHLAVIGNAAQTMHPVAGQGFNVGLRDAWQLAEAVIATAQRQPAQIGSSDFLQAYQQGRQRDTQGGLKFTDFLVRGFSNDIIGLGAMRSLGLALFDVLSPVKSQLIEKMSFGSQR
jgi:2-octaprenyl-6-methoxyphenol hydroxylase